MEERELVTSKLHGKLLLVVTHIGAMSTNSAHSTSKYKTGEFERNNGCWVEVGDEGLEKKTEMVRWQI